MSAYLLKLLENPAIRSAAAAQLARTLFINCIATFLEYRCLLHWLLSLTTYASECEANVQAPTMAALTFLANSEGSACSAVLGL